MITPRRKKVLSFLQEKPKSNKDSQLQEKEYKFKVETLLKSLNKEVLRQNPKLNLYQSEDGPLNQQQSSNAASVIHTSRSQGSNTQQQNNNMQCMIIKKMFSVEPIKNKSIGHSSLSSLANGPSQSKEQISQYKNLQQLLTDTRRYQEEQQNMRTNWLESIDIQKKQLQNKQYNATISGYYQNNNSIPTFSSNQMISQNTQGDQQIISDFDKHKTLLSTFFEQQQNQKQQKKINRTLHPLQINSYEQQQTTKKLTSLQMQSQQSFFQQQNPQLITASTIPNIKQNNLYEVPLQAILSDKFKILFNNANVHSVRVKRQNLSCMQTYLKGKSIIPNLPQLSQKLKKKAQYRQSFLERIKQKKLLQQKSQTTNNSIENNMKNEDILQKSDSYGSSLSVLNSQTNDLKGQTTNSIYLKFKRSQMLMKDLAFNCDKSKTSHKIAEESPISNKYLTERQNHQQELLQPWGKDSFFEDNNI